MITRKKLKRGEIFYADVDSGDRPVRIIVYLTTEGWGAGIVYRDTEEWLDQGVWPDAKSAQQQVESIVRNQLRLSGNISWMSEPPES